MKKSTFMIFIKYIIIGILLSNRLFAQTHRISPAKPQYNDILTIQYMPSNVSNSNFSSPASISLMLYKNILDAPQNIALAKENLNWKTTVTLSDTSIKWMMYAFELTNSIGEMWQDDDNGNYYDILITEQGMPVQGANQARAISYTGIGNRREENLDLALEAIEKELNLYPRNFEAQNLAYSIRLRQTDFSRDVRREIEEEIKEILKQNPQNTNALKFAVNAYRLIGETSKAQRAEQRLIDLNPKGDQAAMNTLSKTLKEEDTEKRLTLLESFLVEYPESRFTEFALSQIVTAAIELDDSTRMIRIGDKLLNISSSPAGASALSGVAGVLAEKQFEINRALAYAEKSIELIRTMDTSLRPPEISKEEWDERQQSTEVQYRDILGWTHFQKGDLDAALIEIGKAAKITFQPGILYHLAEVYRTQGNSDEALLQYARTAAFGGELGDLAYEAFYDLWMQTGKDSLNMESYLNKQEIWVENNHANRILSKRSVHQAPDFNLEALSGGKVQLGDQRGSKIVLLFWATWSESSTQMLIDLQDMLEDYGRDILFLTIAMDRDESDIENFVNKNHIILPVLLNDRTEKAYGLQGVPVLYLIDGRGNIHFEHKGHRPDIQYVLEIELANLP